MANTVTSGNPRSQAKCLARATFRFGMVRRMEIGDRIRKRRIELGLSQAQVAKIVGVSRGAVAQWEGGSARQRAPARENLIPLAGVLQMSVSALVGDGAESAPDLELKPDEIALVTLYRAMRPRQRQNHLSLFYTSVGIDVPGRDSVTVEHHGDPDKGRGVSRLIGIEKPAQAAKK